MDDKALENVLTGLPASNGTKKAQSLLDGPGSRDFARDRRGRPYVVTPEGRTTTYTRCTTYIGVLDDKSNLEMWKMRTLLAWALGTPREKRTDTWTSLYREARAGMTDNRIANALIHRALGEGGSKDRAAAGTAVHTLTQRNDEGTALGEALAASPHLAAYRALTAGWRHLLIEHPTVCDELAVAGTPDRISDTGDPCKTCGNTVRVADVKSGRVDGYTEREQAMQLAIYAHSLAYDTATDTRTPIDVCRHEGVIIHMPIESEDPLRDSGLIRIDIERGWELVQTARAVHAARRVKGLLSPWER
jgi:hypothetical protein